MIVYKTSLEEIPQNCNDCKCHWCRLPIKSNNSGYTDEIKKAYLAKRHKDCPLREVEEEI